jgi:hypothetical protein
MLARMNRRSLILILCFIVSAGIVVLAASLHDVRFEPGRSFAAPSGAQSPISLPRLEMPSDTPLWKLLLLWLVFVINLALFFFLLPPEARKRILRQVISFALGMLALLLALRYRVIHLPEIAASPTEAAGSGLSQLAADSALPSFQRPQMTPWMTYVISLAALWVLFIVGWLYYHWWRRRRSTGNASLASLADIARSSLDNLAAGGQWGDVVIETYARMSDAVRTRRGLQREAATTAREFAGRLTKAGLPSDSVAGLTRLFETVRYGERTSSEGDRREAVACLESILRACGANA